MITRRIVAHRFCLLNMLILLILLFFALVALERINKCSVKLGNMLDQVSIEVSRGIEIESQARLETDEERLNFEAAQKANERQHREAMEEVHAGQFAMGAEVSTAQADARTGETDSAGALEERLAKMEERLSAKMERLVAKTEERLSAMGAANQKDVEGTLRQISACLCNMFHLWVSF